MSNSSFVSSNNSSSSNSSSSSSSNSSIDNSSWDVSTINIVTCVAWDSNANQASCEFKVALQYDSVPALDCDGRVRVTAEDSVSAAVYPSTWVHGLQGDNNRTTTDSTNINTNITANTTNTNTSSSALEEVTAQETQPNMGNVLCDVPDASQLAAGRHDVVCSTYTTITLTSATGNDSIVLEEEVLVASYCAIEVHVAEVTPPIIDCPPSITAVLPSTPLVATVVPVLPSPTAFDNHELARVNCTEAADAPFAYGNHTVTCEAADTSGNTARCAFEVSIEDKHGPALRCPAAVETSVARLTETDVFVDIGDIVAEDNSGITSQTTAAMNLSCTTPGDSRYAIADTTPITCTAVDLAGNAGTCSFDVVVGVDCLGQWTDWECNACPSRTATREFVVSAFPVLTGAACPGPQTRECVNAEPCFRITADVTLGPVTEVERVLGQLREEVDEFLASSLPAMFRLVGVAVGDDQLTITGLREAAGVSRRHARAAVATPAPWQGRDLGVDLGQRVARSNVGHIVASVLIDAEQTAAEEAAVRLQSDETAAELQGDDALDLLRTGSPEDVFQAVTGVALSGVVKESVIPTTTTTATTTTANTTTAQDTTRPGSSSSTAEVPVIAGSVAGALLLIVVVVAVVSWRLKGDAQPVVLSRHVDTNGAQSFVRRDGTLKGKAGRLEARDRNDVQHNPVGCTERAVCVRVCVCLCVCDCVTV